MGRWEYKVLQYVTSKFWGGVNDNVPIEVENEMNKLGQEGWELVSSNYISKTAGVGSVIIYNFKRSL